MNIFDDFRKYAKYNRNVNGTTIDDYAKVQNRIISPTIIEERPMNVASMDIFSALIRDRIIYLTGGIDEDSASIITAQLMYLNSNGDSGDDIKLYINSPGGVVLDGLAIYDVMEWIDADVRTVNMGTSASMASILLSSGAKGKRSALPHSRVMIHQVRGGARGTYADMEIELAEAKKYQDELYNILSNNTGKSFEQITQDASKDCWFTAQEALDYGLIDEVIRKK